ncbi:(1-_4)-alpha-D-glucan 1-alpha-D-glucosylmutase [Variovorax sp. TBS-050B]|uniref:malto-oligosyltrehalose synthase n=1 Tax=Variovorax sp. TBS-050B TaxID=2940551 RepID=UPI0024744844|nr:malto-oligosyltrehalose synthase [Variovorax sp. TBS-050B]MDH6594967.1 (1->4)-alpha-D-glucan 1-alpha-D-glucosylmutase [Variovorax sp. TBS-050B]
MHDSDPRAQAALERLCRHYGISAAYHDAFGTHRAASAENLAALLAEFGVSGDLAAAADALDDAASGGSSLPAMPPVQVLAADAPHGRVLLPSQAAGRRRWRLRDEAGREQQGEAEAQPAHEGGCALHLAPPLAAGYHWLQIDGLAGETLVIASPGRCYRPHAVRDGGRVWGPAVQLYALRSARNWGMGDFGDLEVLIDGMAEQGADVIGLNPLHALFPTEPRHASPYSPSSRQWINVLYIDVEAVDDFAACEPARALVASPGFQARLAALRAAPLVDHAGVAAAKAEVLELLFEHFRTRHLTAVGEAADARGEAFLTFVAAKGEALRRHALFEALQAHFAAADPDCWGWLAWPEAYRRLDAPEVRVFEARHAQRVRYHQYLQWIAEDQLARAGARCEARGMGIGLYLDLAVSVDRGGSDAWTAQDCYAVGASIGAPPDEFNPAGQNWGLPPLRPDRLRLHHHAPFIQMLRANMRHAGALRIDHAMGLMRLFWIPPDRRPHDGAYVRYPVEELLAIVAVESHRQRCLVVGEDLGTVEDAMRHALAAADVLSYRLLYFEKQGGGFRPPADYPPAALVAVSTHDLATLAGWWAGHDLRLRLSLGLFPDPKVFDAQLLDRAQERVRLVLAVRDAGLLAPDEAAQALSQPLPSQRVMQAVHAFLAAAPAALMVFQLEDVAGEVEQANMPGTIDTHPNWRRKLPQSVQSLVAGEAMQGLAEGLRAARPRPAVVGEPVPVPVQQARVPRATYRLQFHKDFGFDDAIRVLPYLAQLGVSHVYCSPIQRARAGSTHGYDVVAHAEVNPELGGAEGFARFVAALRANGLGQLLDLVPNHMGVLGADNAWWMDVLEHGPASRFAQHFDIDWHPLNPELAGKVLLPVLGGHYGEVLENGELVLHFEPEQGSFALRYFDHRFPLAPKSYPAVLERAVPHLKEPALAAELASLSTSFGHLPPREAVTPAQRDERMRDHVLFKARLARLAAAHPAVVRAVAAAVAELNLPSKEARDELDRLIEVQAYRLAYWRVASDEINYRRFFDINELAAVRMEREEVFEATQSFALELTAAGVVDGLRIDHPDGLYDPARYFRQLQEGHARRAGFVLPPADAEGRPARPLYVVAEKIAAADEEVPLEWHVHGTTGYRFANVANGVLLDTGAADALRDVWHAFTRDPRDFDTIARTGKQEVMRSALSSELNVLSTELLRIARADRSTRDFTLNALRRALAAVAACMPVYRTYVIEAPSAQDAHFIDAATREAERQSQDTDRSVFGFVRRALRGEAVPGAPAALAVRVRRFAMRFQQFSAPVAAKGVEDTAFYRYFPLSALNEVGGEPDHFGFDVDEFHALSADRARHWPHTMLATSTHDNKRSEEVRNRIDVLSEMPDEWRDALVRWHARRGDEAEGPSRADAYLLYQTLLGTLPFGGLDAEAAPAYAERIQQYMRKAARESKVRTRWTQPDEAYEAALEALVNGILGDRDEDGCLADIQRMADRLSWFGAWNGLTLTLLKYGSPGVPDLYQGSELIDLSLVDPDNRRPVDYALRSERLAALQAAAGAPDAAARLQALAAAPHDGSAKLWFIWRMLSLRRDDPALFRDGGYEGLAVEGPLARHVVAFARRHEGRMLIVLAGRLFTGIARAGADGVPKLPEGSAWRGTTLRLPAGLEGAVLENVLTGETLRTEAQLLSLDQALSRMPWAAFSLTAPASA